MATAIITGASGGIGLCIAHELAARNYDLLLIARSEEKLRRACQTIEQTFKVKASCLSLDLSEDGSVAVIQDWISTHPSDFRILINNAGYGIWGEVEKIKPEDLANMMKLNMMTIVGLCRMLIPFLRKNRPSYILNVASTAAYQAVPTLSTYAATKAFVVLFSRGLRWELKGSGISVSCLSPGPTSTGFIDRAGMESIQERAEKFSMKPEAVARIAIDGMFRKKAEIIPGLVNWLSVKFTYLLPKSWIEKIAAGLYQ